jgi:hypothetical protein
MLNRRKVTIQSRSWVPESLEKLKIAKCHAQHLQPSLEGFVKGLADFVECKMTTHPNLWTTCVGSIDVDWDKEPDMQRLREACTIHDVSLDESSIPDSGIRIF